MANALMRTYRDVQQRLGASEIDFGRGCPGAPDSPAWNGAREKIADEILRPVTAAPSPIIAPRPERTVDDLGTSFAGGELREHGMEAVAFYKSFRFQDLQPFKGYWGILYLSNGIQYIQRDLEDLGMPHPAWSALEFVRRHERFHFKFDVYALGIESAVSRHLYVPLKHTYRLNRTMQTEEAMANHEAWRWARTQSPEFSQFAHHLMSRQPAAYARFEEPHESLASELAANLLDHNLAFQARRDDQALWVGNIPAAMAHWQSYCPEYWVVV
jgi:hypothetical protein